MITPAVPIAPPPGKHYPGGIPETAFVPILDGVAARLRLTNNKAGDKGFSCAIPAGKLITKNMAASPAPLEVVSWVPGDQASWHQSCTDVVEDSSGGVRKVLWTYDGSALPAMSTNANPAGWSIQVHPWMIRDLAKGYDGGFDETYWSSGDNSYRMTYVAFVPYFKIVASSTTPAVTDGTDQLWYLYFAKPLNSNQTAALQVYVMTGMFGNLQNLAFTVETNAYGQATALKVTLPMATQHVMFSGAFTINVVVTQNLYYLKGDTFVTEGITLISQEFSVNVTLTADTTAPVISRPMILPKAAATAAQQPSILQVQIPGPVGYMDCIAARQTLACDVLDSGGLDRVELWVEWGSAAPKLITSASYGGAKGNTHVEIDTQTLPPLGYDNPLGTPQWTRFLFKAYDMAGNVASAYASSPINGNIGVSTSNPAVTLITPLGGTYTAATGKWDACSGFYARVCAPAAFVSKVEFYVDNILQTTLIGSQGVPDAQGGLVAWGDVVGYTGSFTGLAAGAHTLKAIVYDAVPNGPYSMTNTHTLEQVITVGVTTTGGGGCVDLNAAIAMANGMMKAAWEVQVGDEVLTRNPITGEFAIKPVGAVMPMGVQPVYRLVAEDGVESTISATHRIFEVNSGAYYEAQDLRPGQVVLLEDGQQAEILEITPSGEREVITFSINDPQNKNYFADGVLAHNLKALDCVLPGTHITMADGSTKPIEDVIPGEQILAWNVASKNFVADTFLSHYVTRRSKLYVVTLTDGHVLTCTATHTLFTGSVWVPVEQLARMKAKVSVMVEGGALSAIQSVEEQTLPEPVEVRICEIQNNHNLLLGGILCHNKVQSPTINIVN